MTAPTEQDIRSLLSRRLTEPSSGSHGGGLHGELRGVVKDAAGPLRDVAWEALEATDSDYGEKGQPDPSFAWCDLRATEAYRLMSLMDEAIERAATRCEAIILEELTGAGVTFAAEYPDAPRPVIR